MRLRQEDPSKIAETNMVELTIPNPIETDIYFSAFGQIDRNNRCRQEIFDTEKNLCTKYWSKRFNLSIFVMNVVDVCLEYQGITRTMDIQADLYNYLSEDITDNTYDRFMIRHAEGRRRTIVEYDDDYVDDQISLFVCINGAPRCGISIHDTLTNKKGRNRDETETRYLLHGECKVCQKNTTHVCS